MGRASLYLLWAVFLVLVAGCDQLGLRSTSRLREAAEAAQETGDYPRAVRLYESLLDGTSDSADAHYRLGLIYEDKLEDPISALHHFRRFLKMAPEGDRKRAEVAGYVKRIELVLATRAVEGGFVTKAEAARLKNENLALRTENAALKENLKLVEKGALGTNKEGTDKKAQRDAKGFSTNPVTKAAEQVVGKETRTYTVQKGDTLASISRKFYASPNRWKDIQDANHNALNGSVNLKVGQVLIIP